MSLDRESLSMPANKLGLRGIEFVEYATDRPQALAAVLERLGFELSARHRSREVTLYRQGGMNLVVNAHPDDARVIASVGGQPLIGAVGFRVHDALSAHQRCLALGAWDMPSHAQAMELHIPAITGVGASRFYFVDRCEDFSIFDVDFVPVRSASPTESAQKLPMSYFGLVQYIGAGRTAQWISYYRELFGFEPLAATERYGVMPRGTLLASPCKSFMWQLVEPSDEAHGAREPEHLHRIGLGVPDVAHAVAMLRERGVQFVETPNVRPNARGAITQASLGSVAFELVRADA